MKIIGYIYQAAVHCVSCTKGKTFERDPDHPYAGEGTDENNIPLDAIDGERNLIHPMFSTDETTPRGEYCDDCFDKVATPWVPEGYEVFERTTEENDLTNAGSCWVDADNIALPGGWYWWSCQPGCLPDGNPNGPFGTEEAATLDLTSDIDW